MTNKTSQSLIFRSNSKELIKEMKLFYLIQKQSLGYNNRYDVLKEHAMKEIEKKKFKFENTGKHLVENTLPIYNFAIKLDKEFSTNVVEEYGSGAVQNLVYKYFLKYNKKQK